MLKRWACILSFVFTAFPIPAFAADNPQDKSYLKQDMEYAVYAGGINAVNAHMTLDYTQKGHYSMIFDAQTRGFLGSLVPWEGIFESQGWALPDGQRIVEKHESTALWQGEKEVKTYTYSKEEGFQNLVTLYTHKKPRTEDIDPELTKGTTDVLTATMLVMEHLTNGGKCEGSSEIFDGKRRYALIFKPVQYVMLPESRYNVYSGPAVECTAEVKPIAGAWYKKPRGWLSIQEQGRARGTMPTVWFAQLRDYAIVVPVRVRVKTAYGTLFMHMTHYKSGDKDLKIE